MPHPPPPTNAPKAPHQGVAAPAARWSGAGFLAGAGAVGILWGTLGRTPPPQPIPTSQPAQLTEAITGSATTTAQPHTAQPRTAEPLPLVPAEPQAQRTPAEAQPQPTPAPVPTQQATQPTQQPATQPAPSVLTRININTAGHSQLDTLPRIGPALAQRIIDYRAANGPFRSLQDLERVSGIGPKTVERLAPHVTFD